MVVSHVSNSLSQTVTPKNDLASRKNRRRITRKSPHAVGNATQDQEMTDAETSRTSVTDQLPAENGTGAKREDDELMIDSDPTSLLQTNSAPAFPPLAANADKIRLKSETRRIPVPPHRMTPLKKDWVNIYGPLTEILSLQIRMNVQRRCVEIRVRRNNFCEITRAAHRKFQTSKETKDIGALQKGADFVKAFALGFDVNVRNNHSGVLHNLDIISGCYCLASIR